MPDLSTEAIQRWLQDRDPHLTVAPDDATPPSDEAAPVLPTVLRLGELLDDRNARAPKALRDCLLADRTRATARTVLAQLSRGRRLRLLEWLSTIPGLEELPADLLREATSETGAFLRAEMIALHRSAALQRIFGEDRIATLLAACNYALGRKETVQ